MFQNRRTAVAVAAAAAVLFSVCLKFDMVSYRYIIFWNVSNGTRAGVRAGSVSANVYAGVGDKKK